MSVFRSNHRNMMSTGEAKARGIRDAVVTRSMMTASDLILSHKADGSPDDSDSAVIAISTEESRPTYDIKRLTGAYPGEEIEQFRATVIASGPEKDRPGNRDLFRHVVASLDGLDDTSRYLQAVASIQGIVSGEGRLVSDVGSGEIPEDEYSVVVMVEYAGGGQAMFSVGHDESKPGDGIHSSVLASSESLSLPHLKIDGVASPDPQVLMKRGLTMMDEDELVPLALFSSILTSPQDEVVTFYG